MVPNFDTHSLTHNSMTYWLRLFKAVATKKDSLVQPNIAWSIVIIIKGIPSTFASKNRSLQRDLRKYVKENLKRREILDFVRRDYSSYSWSLTPDRRLRFFDIKYIDYDTPLEAVSNAIDKELNGPGVLL